MIKDVVSTAARLPLAPAKLTGRMAGSLLRQVRGDSADEPQPKKSAARAKPASRSRPRTQRGRAASRTGAKARPKRTAGRSRARATAKRPARAAAKRPARPAAKRPASRGAKPRPQSTRRPEPVVEAPRPEPVDDAAIARNVRSTIFRDLDTDENEVDVKVDEGVVRLRGEVPTPDLIKELEARATRVTAVRRVENLLVVRRTPSVGATEVTAPPPASPEPSAGSDTAEIEAAAIGDPTREESGEQDASTGQGRFTRQDDPDVADLEKDPANQPSDPSLRGVKGG
jgi:hypothetical protein